MFFIMRNGTLAIRKLKVYSVEIIIVFNDISAWNVIFVLKTDPYLFIDHFTNTLNFKSFRSSLSVVVHLWDGSRRPSLT